MNDQQTQDYENNYIKSFMSAIQQPSANLQQTQASTQEVQNQQQLQQRQIDQNNFKTQTQQIFDQYAKQHGGYVPPAIYNQYKGKAGALGIGDGEFDGAFEQAYTDPNSISYNTTTGRANQTAYGETKRQIEAQIDNFNSVPANQKGYTSSSSFGGVPILGGLLEQKLAPDALSYEQNRAGLSATLKNIAGGGSGSGVRVTQTELNQWQNLLPSTRNDAAVNQKNLQILDSLIKAKFNTPVGLDSKYVPQANKPSGQTAGATGETPGSSLTGNDTLDRMLHGAIGDAGSMVTGAAKLGLNTVNNEVNPLARLSDLDPTGTLRSKLSENGLAPEQSNAGQSVDILKGIIGEYGKATGFAQNGKIIDTNEAKNHAIDHPVNTVADILPFLSAAKAATAGSATEGASAADAASGASKADVAAQTPNIPGGLKNALFPGKTIKAASDMRQTAVDAGMKAGNTAKGSDVVAGLKDWSESAKMGNLADADAIDAAVKNAQKIYGGKKLTPQQLVDAYSQADSGYTKNGIPKSPTQSVIDRGLRDVLAQQLEKTAPGWKQSTQQFARGYSAQKGVPAKIVKGIPGNAVKVGMQISGLGMLAHVLGL